jgi:hypothetical protein
MRGGVWLCPCWAESWVSWKLKGGWGTHLLNDGESPTVSVVCALAQHVSVHRGGGHFHGICGCWVGDVVVEKAAGDVLVVDDGWWTTWRWRWTMQVTWGGASSSDLCPHPLTRGGAGIVVGWAVVDGASRPFNWRAPPSFGSS